MENRYSTKRFKSKWLLYVILIFLVIQILMAMYYDQEPDFFDVKSNAEIRASLHQHAMVTGYVTGATFMEVTDVLLGKPGGYMSNDVMPPFVLMDNMPNWEFGVLVQVRDFARVMRNDISRSQSQSEEDEELAAADPKFHNDNDKWIWPQTEGRYREGQAHFHDYLSRLADGTDPEAQFYARTDNLVTWLNLVEKRLGSLSQKLSASVGQDRINTDTGGDEVATTSTFKPSELRVQTSWFKIDDNFYEARGATWALIHFMKAIEVDFKPVLEKKNALVSLKQIIRELEAAQDTIWTPMVLNGSGFGFFANHSLVMASYISRANAGVIDLRQLLEDG
ncbi:DUF2333 family protein [Marinicella sp. S1101]|uniref:DUF2333 family protein n=1 Tax=Marinicella marina TaxID=2996016 RepID=UPI002260CFD6|nr:DUF2333 family protein [Marinicella marina]MCX7552943.1 DUF2333 family protein [Marinicella marina]MDJ1139747.1 DUF2333 family protein [Marinicella marina]